MKHPAVITSEVANQQQPVEIFETDPLLVDQVHWESNARSYPRRIPLSIHKAEGIYVTDNHGKQYIDCLAGAGTLALGHNHPLVLEAIQTVLKQGLPLHTLDLMTPTKHAFMVEILSSLPSSFQNKAKIQFCGPTGADAVEAAIKLCKTATGRENILAFHGAYHGMTQATLSLMGNLGPKQAVRGLMPGVHFLPFPYAYRCPFGLIGEQSVAVNIEMIKRQLNDPESGIAKPAAVILEPIQGEGGVIPAPKAWLQAIRAITHELNIPLIVDEVQTGIGRTGYLYAFEQAGITPDVIVLSKAIGGSLPMAVVVYHKDLDKWQPGAHTGTFRGNVLAMATGRATLMHVQKPEFLSHVTEMGMRLKQHLINMKKLNACIGDVRGRGLMLGVEIVSPNGRPDLIGSLPFDGKRAAKIQQACFERGLIVELGGRYGSVIRFLPPLIINRAQIDVVAEILDEAIKSV